MTTPRVTVIMATYNWSTVLPYSIGSVVQQTFADWELLVVGDHCTDDSAAVVQQLAATDDRIRWVNLTENFGQSAGPNNEGLRQARGELIAYLGHDDLWLPHHLAVLVAALDAGADLVYGLTAMIGVGDHATGTAPPSAHTYHSGMWLPPTGTMHRRKVVEVVGAWGNYRELVVDPEADLWQRIHAAGYTIRWVPRLTAIKFPALWRRNVYTLRPSHEQAAWMERIRTEPDLELITLATLLAHAPNPLPLPIRAEALALLKRIRSAVWRRIFRPRIHRLDTAREFKGLERKP